MRTEFPLPLAPASAFLSRFLRAMAARHPSILRRLGPHVGARILIDVSDAPLILLMEPALRRLTAHRRSRPPAADAAIRGRLAAFLSMLHGTEDGDALFFSGDLEISGDTAAVLALRNAIDDAELDLTEELARMGGPAGPMLRRLSALAERHSGLQLSRAPFGAETELEVTR
jgi:predicted lipid carrier protein YhbT